MQNENSISKVTMPLRFLYDWLTDEEFKVVMSGLSKKELDILKLVFGPEYLNLNSVKLTDYEVTILNRTLTEKISRRANLVMVNRNKKKKESENASSKHEKTIRKTIYDYFKKYNKEAVLKAILHLETKDYETLMMMCDNDLTKPIDLNKHPKFYDDVYLKIEEDLLKFPNYNFEHINLENIISNEVASSIIDFMKDKTYQDLQKIFTPEEALLYAMKYGLINNTRFSMEMMIVVLQLDVKKIQSLLQDIMFKLQSKAPDNNIKR